MVALATRRNYTDGKEIAGWREHDAQCGFPVYRMDLLRPEMMPPPANKLVSAWRFLTIDIPLRVHLVAKVWSLMRKHGVRVICIGELNRPPGSAACSSGARHSGDPLRPRRGDHHPLQRRLLRAAAAAICRRRRHRVGEPLHPEGAGRADGRPPRADLPDRERRRHPALLAGPDDTAFRAKFGLGHKRLVVAVGRLVPRKGFDKTIAAWAAVHAAHPDAQLVIVGDGPQRAELQALADASGAADSITLTGSVSDAELLAAYRSASLFVMPNRTMPDGDTEGFGSSSSRPTPAAGPSSAGGRAGPSRRCGTVRAACS
jgi:phosphatidylinositol alpha-1,6-mannosyltransferase